MDVVPSCLSRGNVFVFNQASCLQPVKEELGTAFSPTHLHLCDGVGKVDLDTIDCIELHQCV